MQSREETPARAVSPLWTRPVFVLAGLVLILLLNAFILVKQGTGDTMNQVAEQNEQTLSETEDIYSSNSSFDIESYVQQ